METRNSNRSERGFRKLSSPLLTQPFPLSVPPPSLPPPPPTSLTMSLSHLLYESASGYAIFSVSLQDEVANATKQFQDSIADLHKFGQMVQLKSFAPFTSAAHALENANDVSEGEASSPFDDHVTSQTNSTRRGATYEAAASA